MNKKSEQHIKYIAELRCINHLKDEGYTVFRVYQNSKTVNIIAINEQIVRIIKVRTTAKEEAKINPEERLALMTINMPKNIKIEIWVWQIGKGWYNQTII